ncbi:MAG: 3-oxoacyl-[acyl-carrier-protein] synthase III C-terminal domain-containing protein, partial [Bacteroidia bacterium]
QAMAVLDHAVPGSHALVLSGDFSSRIMDENDPSTAMIFSDAVAGALLRHGAHSPSFFNLETWGQGQKAIYSEWEQGKAVMRLNGIDVFAQSLGQVPAHLRALWSYAELDRPADCTHYLHQANKVINDALSKQLSLGKAPSSLEVFGNSSSASIPLTLLHQQPTASQVVLCGFGVGFSVASAALHVSDSCRFRLLELPS